MFKIKIKIDLWGYFFFHILNVFRLNLLSIWFIFPVGSTQWPLIWIFFPYIWEFQVHVVGGVNLFGYFLHTLPLQNYLDVILLLFLTLLKTTLLSLTSWSLAPNSFLKFCLGILLVIYILERVFPQFSMIEKIIVNNGSLYAVSLSVVSKLQDRCLGRSSGTLEASGGNSSFHTNLLKQLDLVVSYRSLSLAW